MRAFLALISAVLLTASAWGQSLLPETAGARVTLSALIEMPKGYVGGICVILREEEQLHCCLFNEFGITALDFSYDIAKQKVKINNAVSMLNKWHIKRTLRGDLKHVIMGLERGDTLYTNQKRGITYEFKPIADDTEG